MSTFKKSLSATLLIAATAFGASGAVAQDSAADQTRAQIAEMMGGTVPNFVGSVADAALPGLWAQTMSLEMGEGTALDTKTKALISVAVAAQIPCHYCVWIDTNIRHSFLRKTIKSSKPYSIAINYTDEAFIVASAEFTRVQVSYDDGVVETYAANLPLVIAGRAYTSKNSVSGGRIVETELRVVSGKIPDHGTVINPSGKDRITGPGTVVWQFLRHGIVLAGCDGGCCRPACHGSDARRMTRGDDQTLTDVSEMACGNARLRVLHATYTTPPTRFRVAAVAFVGTLLKLPHEPPRKASV